MAQRVTTGRKIFNTAAAYFVGFLIFFPILWMVLASFKTELEAFAMPPTTSRTTSAWSLPAAK